MLARVSAALIVGGLATGSALAQAALPGWVPVETTGKAFNDAAGDLGARVRFVLDQCADVGRRFVCTYAATTGIGLSALGPRDSNLAEQLVIALPPCNVARDLREIAGILIHIFHPRRPPETFGRAIVAMSGPALQRGGAEYRLDGVSYRLSARPYGGYTLVVRRVPQPADLAGVAAPSRPRRVAVRRHPPRAAPPPLAPPPVVCPEP